MPNDPAPPAQSFVENLQPLLCGTGDRVTLGEIAARVDGDGDSGLAPVLFVLTLPALMPMPPGVSMVLALPLLVIAPQIVAGRSRLWLPRSLADRSMERKALAKLLRRVLPALKRVEAVVKPRLGLLTGVVGARLVGVGSTLMAVILILPIPFANLVPALALGAFSLGLARRDGLLVLAGYALVAVTVGVIALGGHEIVLGLGRLRGLL